jgi:hypothetical protein
MIQPCSQIITNSLQQTISFRWKKAFQTFNKVPILLSRFSDIESINTHLAEDDSVLVLMRERLSTQNRNITLRNLQMFHVLLEQLRVDNSNYTKYAG